MAVNPSKINNLDAPLLATRFFMPQLPAALAPRPRLEECLEQGLQVPLTLLSAPPGFGKSSLVSQWIHSQANLKTGWLSLVLSDQEWSQFFHYLVAAWQHVFPQVGQAALVKLNDPPPIHKETLLNLLLNDLLAALDGDADVHALLVLDDYHRIEAAEIHETVAYLIEHLPPRCHIVLLTRADPPLPLARWRSRRLLLELRADDLRFTPQESGEYLNQCLRLGLSGDQVSILSERTEGWIVGLQMAALSLQGYKDSGKNAQAFIQEFGGSNRFVLDYLIEEVVNCQPAEVQQFLMVTSLLDQFCGPLCDVLLGATASYSQRMLERLEKMNLFLIPLDDHRQWFRYHHLFAELLRVRMHQDHPGQIPALYRQAAEWFAENSAWQDAIRYALLTKDFGFSTTMFEQAILKGGLQFLYSGIKPLIEQFPADIIENRPLLSLGKAVVILESWQPEGIETLLRSAEQGVRTLPPFPGQEDVLGWIYVIQSNAATWLGDYNWMVEATRQVPKWISKDFVTTFEALAQYGFSAYYEGNLNQTESFWLQALDLSTTNKNTYYTLAMLNGVARICFQKGELIRSEALFHQAFELLEAHSGQYLRWLGAMQRDYSDLLRDSNRLEEAQALISSAIPLLEKWHTISALGYGYFSAARIQLASGDLPGAHERLDKLDDLDRRYKLYPDLETLAQVTRARIYLEEGKPDKAMQMLEDCLHSPSGQYTYPREWIISAQARIFVRTGHAAEALTLLAGWSENAKANGRLRNWLTICLISALAYEDLGDRLTALQLLGAGLAFAQAQGHRRALLEEGEPLRDLLEGLRIQSPQSPLTGYIEEILSLFPPPTIGKPATSIKVDGLFETLSPREVEILHLVCQGLSNREIADRLVLSVGTVKFHIHNLFGKLDVRDRPQAIAKAQRLEL